MLNIAIGVVFILTGLSFFRAKYKIIIGGTACVAKIIEVDESFEGKIGTHYYLVEFEYNGEPLRKISNFSTRFFPKSNIDKKFLVYYNEKYPDSVSLKGGISENIFFSLLVTIGVLVLVYTVFGL